MWELSSSSLQALRVQQFMTEMFYSNKQQQIEKIKVFDGASAEPGGFN